MNYNVSRSGYALHVLLDAWFTSWERVGEVAATAVLAYVGLVLVLRAGGKRTLARFNVFDWVVTVAFGSTVATTIVSDTVSLVDGLAALATLVVVQTVVAFVSTRSNRAEQVLKGRPALLAYRGELLRDAMRRERVAEDEIRQALRAGSAGSLDGVTAVVLETNGNLSILTGGDGDVPALEGVRR